MQNPMLQAVNNSLLGQILNPVKSLFNAVRTAQNPQLVMNQMISQNPTVRQAQDYVSRNGGDSKAAFYNLANQMGVNPDEIISMFK